MSRGLGSQSEFDASTGIARLDERLKMGPAAVRNGWVNRAFIHEACASLRLNGHYVDPKAFMLTLVDSLDRPSDHDLERASDIHRMLQALGRRNSRHLFSPHRLIAVMRLRPRGHQLPPEPVPDWLGDHLKNPEEMRDALAQALDPSAVFAWRKLTPVAAAAEIIAHWHSSGAAHAIGAAPGRALAMAWLHRVGLTAGYYFLPSVGFLGHAWEYRPDVEASWQTRFMAASERAAKWGVNLYTRLTWSHRRLHEFVSGKRRNSHMSGLADLIVASLIVSARQASQTLKITPTGARGLLIQLEKKSLIHELTGRGSFRLYSLPQ